MSLDIYVYGFRPPDERWQKMKAIYQACKSAGVKLPEEVESFFGDDSPDGPGRQVHIPHSVTADHTTYEVNLDHIPKDIRLIQFVVSM